MFDVSEAAALGALFVSAFLAATILPGGSEAAFAGVLLLYPAQWLPALALATVGNALGGMSTYLLARFLPRKEIPSRLEWVRRHGAIVLLLSWTPLLGDALCAAAGFLRLPWLACFLWMALGKGLRYGVIAWALQ